MSIPIQGQCENMAAKLRDLERLYEGKPQSSGREYVRDLTLRSLRKQINPFQEQVDWFEARATTSASK